MPSKNIKDSTTAADDCCNATSAYLNKNTRPKNLRNRKLGRVAALIVIVVCLSIVAVAITTSLKDSNLPRMASLCDVSRPGRLKAVLLIHRHGVRTPFINIPSLLPSHVDPATLGHLAPVGRNQIDALGTFIRHRYPNIFEENAKFFDAYTSGVTRCQESAKVFYASAMPNKVVDVKVLDQDFQAMYGRMIEHNADAMEKAPFSSPFGNTVGDFVNHLAKIVESPHNEFKLNYQVVDLAEVAEYNSWNTTHLKDVEPYWEYFPEAENAYLNMLYRDFEWDLCGQMVQLSIEYLKKIAADLNTNSTSKQDNHGLFTFSVSDISMTPFMKVLGFPLKEWPEFAETLVFEMDHDGQVRIVQVSVNAKAECSISTKRTINRTPKEYTLSLDELIERCERALTLNATKT